MSKLIYIDTETTGLSPAKCGILQLAYIIEIDGEVAKRGSYKINPNTYKKDVRVDSKALECNGIKESEFNDFIGSRVALNDFIEVMQRYLDGDERFTVVAYNAAFDVGFVRAWFRDCGYDSYGKYFSYKPLDPFALVLYLQHIGVIDTGKSQNLESSCRAIGLEFDAHDAVGDIEATRDLHLRLIKRITND